MKSKEALDKLPDLIMAKNILCLKEITDCFNIIANDLEKLESIRDKTHLLYKDRKKIAKEFDKWCIENNAVNCSENMVTWFLGVKLKEWLNND